MPLTIDLYCGLGGWAEGFLAEGYDVVGFDIERHDYGTGGYPGQLVLQDVLTLHGSQFRNAVVIVASPPCQAYSYRAMPWKRAKALPPPDNSLFDACFRIQREACEAAGRYIPLIVENVVGAQKWVGRARWHFGSFYLWGDVPALMPVTVRSAKVNGQNWNRYNETGEVSPHWRMEGLKANTHGESIKNQGGSWFNVAHNTTSGKGRNPDGRKTKGHLNIRDGHSHTRHLTNPAEHIKQGGDWFGRECQSSMSRLYGSKSVKRKAASAQIAKIPFPLSQHIARCFKCSTSSP
jgi:hypothetical protein